MYIVYIINLSKTKKILTNFLILLVLLSNAGFAISSTVCEMTKKSVCSCSMNEDNNTKNTSDKLSVHRNSCCKTEVKFISNTSDYESFQNVSIRDIFNVLITSKLFQISNPIFSNIKGKEVLLFYKIPDDIPVKNSSLLI